MSLDRVIVALDFSNKKEALMIVDKLDELIEFYKVGFELFVSEGVDILRSLKKRNKRVFLDLKLYDIPNTVMKALKVILTYGVDMLSLHTMGGFDMLKRAKDVLEEAKIKENITLKLLGVTVLTSLDSETLREIYDFNLTVSSLVKRLSMLAKKAGLDGVIASAHEISVIRENCGEDFLIVTPGVRLEKLPYDDQKRTVTPKEAFMLGADYIVIGRALTCCQNPKGVLIDIFS